MLTPEEKQEILLKLFYDFKEKDNINNLALNKIDEAKKKVEAAEKNLEAAKEELEAAKDEREKTNKKLNDITKLLDLAEKTWNLSVSPRGSEIIFQKYYI